MGTSLSLTVGHISDGTVVVKVDIQPEALNNILSERYIPIAPSQCLWAFL